MNELIINRQCDLVMSLVKAAGTPELLLASGTKVTIRATEDERSIVFHTEHCLGTVTYNDVTGWRTVGHGQWHLDAGLDQAAYVLRIQVEVGKVLQLLLQDQELKLQSRFSL